jgi:hypothetical protein
VPLDDPYRECGQRRIACARHVRHLEHRRLDVPNRHPSPDQRHARFGAGHENGPVELACDSCAGDLDLGIGRTGHAAGSRQFAGVWLDEISAAIGLERVTLGIDQHQFSERLGRANHLLEHVIAKYALGIVGDRHDVGVRHRGAGGLNNRRFSVVRQPPRDLPVNSEKLLPTAHNARLAYGRPRRICYEMHA